MLDPIMALVERVDRGRRHIRPVRDGALLGIEERRHRGPPLRLADGVVVARGAPVWAIHFDNARLRQLGQAGWQGRALAAGRSDLRSLAARVEALPAARRPVAVTGVTLLAPLVVRTGFEARERRRTARVRLEDWYLRSLLARWSVEGRSRLARGQGILRSREVWLSTQELLRRYPGGGKSPGSPPP